MKVKKLMATLLSLTVSASAMFIVPSVSATTTASDTQPLKIMSVGDSITDGYWEQGSYRKYMYKLLTDNGYNIDMVGPKGSNSQNSNGFTYDGNYCGYSGYAIENISGTETRSGIYEVLTNGNVMENYNPDLVLLQIGTNDVLSAYNEGIENRLENLIDYMLTFLNDEEDVLFVTSIPYMDVEEVYSWFWPYGNIYYSMEKSDFCDLIDNYIDIYNAKIETLVKEKQAEGKHIQFADINSIVDINTDLNDGVHPNEKGYQKMGEYWFTVLESYLSGETSNNYTYSENGLDITSSIKSGEYSFSDNVVLASKDGTITVPETTTTTQTTDTTSEIITTTTQTTDTTSEIITTTTTQETTPIEDGKYISLPVKDRKVDLSSYAGKFDKIKLTFTDTFNGNGALCFYSDNTWFGQICYNGNGTNSIVIDVSEYNNAKTGEIVFWYNPTGADIKQVAILNGEVTESVTTTEDTTITTTVPVTTTEDTTTTTTTVPVTTSEATTTTESELTYIPVKKEGSTIDISKYSNVVGLTFDLTNSSTGSGACHLKGTQGEWLGSIDYSYNNQKNVIVDLTKFSNIGTIDLYMWWNSVGATIENVQIIVKE